MKEYDIQNNKGYDGEESYDNVILTIEDNRRKTEQVETKPKPAETEIVEPEKLQESEEFQEPEEKPKRKLSKKEIMIRSLMSGSILSQDDVVKHIPYVVFIMLLMFLYIANGYRIQRLHNEHRKLKTEVKELRAKSINTTAIMMTSTRQSYIIEQLKNRNIDLVESLTPPEVIE